mgnify:CR=1 FL=1
MAGAVASPIAFGLFDKVVALPPRFMAMEDRAARDLAIAHELAHHEGHDIAAGTVDVMQRRLRDCAATLGPDRVICVAKEITKIHETFLIGLAADGILVGGEAGRADEDPGPWVVEEPVGTAALARTSRRSPTIRRAGRASSSRGCSNSSP